VRVDLLAADLARRALRRFAGLAEQARQVLHHRLQHTQLLRPHMQAVPEYAALVELVRWIDEQTSDLALPTDERTQLALGCFDVALEHQAAITLLHLARLPGSMLALLRALTESLVRGLWLNECATELQLQKFKDGKLDKPFGALVKEYEEKIASPSGVLTGFKLSAYAELNDFTRTGFLQVSRRHGPGVIGPNYAEADLARALEVAGALGLIAAGQIIAIAGRRDLVPAFTQRIARYA
jgi:hypothetical protein